MRQAASAHLKTRPPESLEAYELTLRGRKALLTFTREGATEALALADRAIAIDPDYAAAWEVRAGALLQFYIQPYGQQASPEVLSDARAAAERAVALDSNYATGQAMLAFALMWAREHDASLEAIRKAVSLNPNDASAHATHGNILTFAGFNREAIDAWDENMRVDPFFPALSLALKAIPHIMLEEFEPTLALTRPCAQRAPKLFACFLYLAIAANELGLEDEAADAAARLLDINPHFGIARHMRMVPFRDEDSATQLAKYMRRVGLPE